MLGVTSVKQVPASKGQFLLSQMFILIENLPVLSHHLPLECCFYSIPWPNARDRLWL